MYGMTAKRFDPDPYKRRKDLKKLDFALGFSVSALLWLIFFNLWWFAAPLVILCASMLGFKYKLKRRYVIYGALALVFFPLVLWGGLMVGWFGRNELR